MKQNKKVVRIVCAVLAIFLILSFLSPLIGLVYAETAAEKVDRLQAELDAIEAQIAANENDISKQENVKAYYVQQSNLLEQQIAAMLVNIADSEAQLAAKEVELEAKILDVAETKQLFEDRIVGMYKTQNRNVLSTLLGASSFAEAMRYAKNFQELSISDTEMVELLRTEQAELETQKAEQEAIVADLNTQKQELETAQQQYAVSIQAVNNSISAAEAELAAQEAAYGDSHAQLQVAKDELQAWLNENSNVDLEWGGGTFGAPIQNYSYISSGYGWRTLWGKPDFHRGVDFAAAAGTPIYAAESGIVGTTNLHSSYGICVKISHGSGLVSLYAHMSARAAGITDGVYVSRGQLIGYVGSTGNSSGNHLHFEINLNGQPVDPWPYLKG